MSDTTVVEVPGASQGSHAAFSWSAAIAGAFAATAVTLIIASLGAGIGLPFASPYSSGVSATGLTAAAAVWLVMAQTIGFATGGYLAGRLRSPAYDGVVGERTFRDAAQGLMVWAIGVVVVAGILGLFAAGATTHLASGLLPGLAQRGGAESASSPAGSALTQYYADTLFRPAPGATTAGGQRASGSGNEAATVGAGAAAVQPALAAENREAASILARSAVQRGLDDSDRTYLAQLVSARTGLPPDEAQRRVSETEAKVKDAADRAAKGGAYLAFWTFMSLLFGGVAATLAGMLGGQLRDAERRSVAIP